MKKTIIFCAGAPLAYVDKVKDVQFPILVGVDGGTKILIEAGYTLDFAIGDFDSTIVPQAKEVIVLPTKKDDTDLQYALYTVLSQFHLDDIEEVIVLGALGGGRLDHLLCNIWLAFDVKLEKWFPKLHLVDEKNSASFYLPGTYSLQKEEHKKYLSFILMSPVKHLSLSGVEYPLDKKSYDRPRSLISNEFLENDMTFSFETGLICVMQTID
ncbi:MULTISPECIES: thiamine diphosphokinase [unclassified Granulicatella]|uniref:thiamine diphosphokinase n=1 Tax=unclassified Granulicatella TaxID=2630493 RepID=UPI001073118D|nr:MULTISPECIES: thiamine diphosphokinase [unclassified Granulicatella]MBF0780196.1 thiamine diphosphokinase [Granulicatella sp. 19428wC4_WM01]TFU95689.1 thiamine diphosphokinase [Granulicatella sp. WM01]